MASKSLLGASRSLLGASSSLKNKNIIRLLQKCHEFLPFMLLMPFIHFVSTSCAATIQFLWIQHRCSTLKRKKSIQNKFPATKNPSEATIFCHSPSSITAAVIPSPSDASKASHRNPVALFLPSNAS